MKGISGALAPNRRPPGGSRRSGRSCVHQEYELVKDFNAVLVFKGFFPHMQSIIWLIGRTSTRGAARSVRQRPEMREAELTRRQEGTKVFVLKLCPIRIFKNIPSLSSSLH